MIYVEFPHQYAHIYCQSTLINITASFNPENYEIEMYLLDNASCAGCGALLTAPTPVDLFL